MRVLMGQGDRSYWVLMLAMMLLAVGFALVLLGALISAGANVSGGGVIIIGPIPIMVGFGPYGQVLTLISAIMALLVVVLYALWFIRGRKVTN